MYPHALSCPCVQLLLRRLEVAEALQQEEAVEGLRLLYRR